MSVSPVVSSVVCPVVRSVLGLPTFTGPLDTNPDAEVAFSFQSLSAEWVGQAVFIGQRASDSATLSFTSAEITDGTLETWSQSGDVGVLTLLGQAGNSNNATQTDEAKQRRIVIAGSLVTEGGFPAMEGNAFSYAMTSPFNLIDDFSILFLANPGSTEALFGRTSSNNPRIRFSTTNIEIVENGAGEVNFTGTDLAPSLHSYDGTRSLTGIYRDVSDDIDCTIAGKSVASGPLSLAGNFNVNQIFAYGSTMLSPMTGAFQELIIWNRDIR